MTYHLKNWEYFIEMSCFIPVNMIELTSNSLKLLEIGVSGTPFGRIVNSAKCARTRDGLETIMLLTLQDYIGDELKKDETIFDKFLEYIDEQLEGLKKDWGENHSAGIRFSY